MAQDLYWAYVGFTDIVDGKTRPILYIRQTKIADPSKFKKFIKTDNYKNFN